MSNDRLLSNQHGLCQAMFSNEQNQKDLIKYPFLRCWTWSFECLMRFFWLTSKRYFSFIKLSVSVESSTCIKTVTCHTNIFLVTSIKFVCSEVTTSSRSSRMTWAFWSTLYEHNVILLSWCLDPNSWRIFVPRVTLTQKIALVTIASESTQLEFWEITKCQGMSTYLYANYLVEYLEQKHITLNLTLLERDRYKVNPNQPVKRREN